VGICASVALNRRGFARVLKRQSVGGASIVLCRWGKRVIRNHPGRESEKTLNREWEGEGRSLESWYNSFPMFPQIFSNSNVGIATWYNDPLPRYWIDSGRHIRSRFQCVSFVVSSESLLMSFSFIDNRNHLPPALRRALTRNSYRGSSPKK
jgi:hypothetical protein